MSLESKFLATLYDGTVGANFTVTVHYLDKWIGDYSITFCHRSTLQLRNLDKNRSKAPLYIPNPHAVNSRIEESADNRVFVTILEEERVIYNLTFRPLESA